jgi:3-phenylpropionate/trans-cinnamate dioxygenase ferredoxin subunit
MTEWVTACQVEDIEPEDVIRFDHGGATYAIYRDPAGGFHATAGLCTHENVHLAEGLVMGDQIECPKHNGRFNYKTGAALRAPVCVNLRVHPVRVAGNRVEIGLD